MLFYVESKLYPGRTMVLVCSRGDSVARAKALLLHILSDISHKADHFFRLKYRGEFLKDALSLQDYGIDDMSVVKMIPLYRAAAVGQLDATNQQPGEIFAALYKEKLKFQHRSFLLVFLKALVWLQLLSVIGNFVTVFWWAGLWVGPLTLAAMYLMPIYLHVEGSIGRMSSWDKRFMLAYSLLLMLVAIGDLAMFLFIVIRTLIPRCDVASTYYNKHGIYHCSYRVWFAAVFLPAQLLLTTAASILCVLLHHNFKFEAGQLVEPCLVQTRDINKVLYAAQRGNGRERHVATFELVNMAVTDDNNKFLIVQENGLQVMLTLLTSGQVNEETKDYAAEALAELLTLEAIQDEFVRLGGLPTLCALLRSSQERVVYEASCALSFISSRDEHNSLIVDSNGLGDLMYPVQHGCSVEVAEFLSGILLDLCLNVNTRPAIMAHPKIVTTLASLMTMGGVTCQSSLQSLELLVIDDDRLLQPVILDHMINIASHTPPDKVIAQLISKLLSCYANSEERVGLIVSHDHLMPALMSLVQVGDADVIESIVAVVTVLSQHELFKSQVELDQLKRKLALLSGEVPPHWSSL